MVGLAHLRRVPPYFGVRVHLLLYLHFDQLTGFECQLHLEFFLDLLAAVLFEAEYLVVQFQLGGVVLEHLGEVVEVGGALGYEQGVADVLEVHCEVVQDAQIQLLELGVQLSLFVAALLQKSEGLFEELRKSVSTRLNMLDISGTILVKPNS